VSLCFTLSALYMGGNELRKLRKQVLLHEPDMRRSASSCLRSKTPDCLQCMTLIEPHTSMSLHDQPSSAYAYSFGHVICPKFSELSSAVINHQVTESRHKHIYIRQGLLVQRHIRLTSPYIQNHARHISRHPHPRRRAQYRPGSRSDLCLERLQGCPRSPVTEGGRQHGQSTEHRN
jgi:hypothetical protein